MTSNCKLCNGIFRGRQDKIFCSAKCKSNYHHHLRKETKPITIHIDTILHRNRIILLEIMGTKKQLKVPLSKLTKMKFNFTHITHSRVNSKGKTYNFVYDYSWMRFSDNEVLINKRRS